jgi:hypothetical protein
MFAIYAQNLCNFDRQKFQKIFQTRFETGNFFGFWAIKFLRSTGRFWSERKGTRA